MNLSIDRYLYITFTSVGLIAGAIFPDAHAGAICVITSSALLGLSLWLASRKIEHTETLELKVQALKERLDMMAIQRGLSR